MTTIRRILNWMCNYSKRRRARIEDRKREKEHDRQAGMFAVMAFQAFQEDRNIKAVVGDADGIKEFIK